MPVKRVELRMHVPEENAGNAIRLLIKRGKKGNAEQSSRNVRSNKRRAHVLNTDNKDRSLLTLACSTSVKMSQLRPAQTFPSFSFQLLESIS